MKVQFNVQMTRQYLFDFFLQHTYRTLRGKLSLLAGLAMIPLCVLTWNRVGRMFSVCYIFFAVFFLLLMPGKLWIKADQGFKRTPVYRKPFTYKVDSTGITTIQNAQTGHLKWNQVEKVIDSQLCLYVYINKADAYVWPKAAVGKNYQKLLELLKKQENTTKIPAGIKDEVETANKTGETDEDQHDIAIVYGAKTTYVLCVMSEGWKSGGDAVQNIQNISSMVYNYLNL